MIGVSITELVDDEMWLDVEDPRFLTDGLQCRIDAVAADGSALIDYRMRKPGEICMPLPDAFRIKAVEALVGSINADATLTALGSTLYLVTSFGDLKVCGNISTLSATTTVALRGEAAGELPPTPAPVPVAGDIDTGGGRLSEAQVAALMLIGIATDHRRSRDMAPQTSRSARRLNRVLTASSCRSTPRWGKAIARRVLRWFVEQRLYIAEIAPPRDRQISGSNRDLRRIFVSWEWLS